MLDFKEFPTDGVRFEQLVRELLLIEGMRPFWTGQGSDGGRDLLVEEPLKGTLRDGARRWLVDCKHKAHSNKSVGVSDVSEIVDRCRSAATDGILLVCSTQISAGLARRLKEIAEVSGILSEVWDVVTLERKLYSPAAFHISQQFFPLSTRGVPWRIYFSERNDCWIANFEGNFLYLESRAGISPPPLSQIETIIRCLDGVSLGEGEQLRIRRIWHDTPNGPFYNVEADYLVPSTSPAKLTPLDMLTLLPQDCILGGAVDWYIKLQVVLPMSDYYSADDPVFYPFSGRRVTSTETFGRLNDMARHNKWAHLAPPPVRTSNDGMMWERDKANFGYKELGRLSIREC